MKKKYLLIFILLIFCLTSCSKQETEKPGETVVNFLNALQQQNYASAKAYYSENLDNLPNFKNKIEAISPAVANELFNKLADFSYTIKKVEIDPNDKNKASVTVSLQCYDLGSAFQNIILDYLKTDLEMTFDGAKDEEIIQKAEETILADISKSEKTFRQAIMIALTKEDDVWKLDKISENRELLNALSGNIINTIEEINNDINTIK
ncbi:DUF4878 domain-containing protein [Cellulosilyticum lentocellum]|uniref:Putative lipoprotein n=1 Tax=Cellulosilyticum lentocellum (strain ATCC 49066 / DSM 5427 / NCIMB 11756 / RHM5) TaxID=642492 RepID=F2JPG0_CELLD|nr:DUF4878 domain-containing protein [Cellulosilyticum lentocellum]ADZ82508.1 putative lipoprotein [Cellulosilyticum lentocellum DSM 5427]